METPIGDSRDPSSIPLPTSPEKSPADLSPKPTHSDLPSRSASRASSVSVPHVHSPEVSPRTLVRPRLPGRGQTITSLRAQREEDAWEARETIEGRGGPDPFMEGTTINVNEPVGSLSISPSNRDIALASRKGLFILDLANLNVAPRFVPQGGTWQIADCQWSPHPYTSNLILSTSSQKLLVWDLLSTSPSTSLHRSINAHARAITDINWHARDPNLMATTGMDGGVRGWDLRVGDDRPVMRVCAWGGAGTQCKWNRQHDHLLATAHGGEVFVWDNRKGSLPVTIIKAHDAKIYGIDWDRISRHELVTCSLDKTVKFWSIAEMSPAANPKSNLGDFFPTVSAPDTPKSTIHTSYPVWRARNLPFGRGCMSLPQRGDNALEMWQTTQGDGPVERFQGHNDVVKEFVWRTRGGQDPSYEDRDFQLITWAKDRTIRIWPMEPDVLERVGHRRGSSIEVLVSRRHALDISYTRPELLPPEVLCPTSNLTFPSNAAATSNVPGRAPYVSVPTTGALQIIASARAQPNARPIIPGTEHLGGKASPAIVGNAPSGIARQGKALQTTRVVPTRKAAMTRGGAGQKAKAGGQISQVDWLTKVVKVPRETNESHNVSSAEASTLASRVNSVSVSKSRRESDSRPTSRSRDRRTMLSSSIDGMGEDNKLISLKDEIVLVLQTFPKPKINFEMVDIAHRKVTMTLNGPWAEGDRLAFTRIHVSFPQAYPYSASPEDWPSFELEKNHSVPPATRQRIVQTLKAIRSHNRQCLLAWCSFLLGYNERLGRTMFDDDNDSESDADNEPVSLPMLARSCGASFGPNGELVCFFQKQVTVPKQRGSVSRSPSLGSKVTTFSSQQVHSPTLIKAMSALSRLNDKGGSSSKRRKHDGLANAVARGLANRPTRHMPLGRAAFTLDTSTSLKPSSVVSIKDFSSLGGVPHRALAEVYETTGLPDEVCARNMQLALAAGHLDHAQVWSLLASVLAVVAPTDEKTRGRHPSLLRGEQPAFSTANDAWDRKIARKKVIVDQMVAKLSAAGDFQMLALIACVMSQYIVIPSSASSPKHVVIQSPERDYFALPRRTSSNMAYTTTPGTLVPNTPRANSPSAQSPSGFPGFSGYSGYSFGSSKNSGWSQILNSSSISLRSNAFNAASASMASFRERMPSDASVLKTPTLSTSYEESASHSIPVPAGSKAHPHPQPQPSPRPKEPRPGSIRERSNSPRPRLGYTPGKSAGSTDPGSARSSGRVAFGGSHSPMRKAVAGCAVPPPMARKGGNGQKWSIGVDVGPDDHHLLTMSVLDPAWLWQYEAYRRAYADFLLRWEFYGKRAALLQYSLAGEVKTSKQVELDMAHLCPRCSDRVLTASMSACPGCERPRAPPKCSVCRLPVRGLATTCLLCTHISHARCLSEHFGPQGSDMCPSGCGCACLTSAGISGTFESLPLVPKSDFDVADWHGERVQDDSPAPTPTTAEPIPTPPALGLTTHRAPTGGLLAKARLRGLTGDALLHW